MTNRINALVVTLEKNFREDDCEHIVNAIRMIKGVMSVDMNVAQIADHVAETRAYTSLRNEMWAVLNQDHCCKRTGS
jgi:hypothetical protein